MKISPILLLLGVTMPVPLLAQDTLAAEPADAPPPGLTAAELARSRRCVPTLARLDTLNTSLNPMVLRVERIRALVDAAAREDSSTVMPFDVGDPLEKAVQQWFTADQVLARQYAATGDSAIEERRAEGRNQIGERLREAIEAVDAEAEATVAATGELQADVRECENVILVRGAVLEQCETMDSPVCAEAQAVPPSRSIRFVDAPEEMWDMESISLWNRPTGLVPTPQGGMSGAQTSTISRRGNLFLALAVQLMIQDRSTLSPDQLAEFQAGLDSLAVTFSHPQYLIAPALALEFRVADPLGDENYYFLHFGDLTEPAKDVIWSAPTSARGPVQAVFPANKAVLDRLAAGEIVSLTAVRFAEPTAKQGETVYNLELTSVGQASSVSAFLSYITGDELAADFMALVPPAGG